MESIAQALRAYLDLEDETPATLARRARINRQTVDRVLAGGAPSVFTLRALHAATGGAIGLHLVEPPGEG